MSYKAYNTRMANNLIEIAVVLDRSGSMDSIKDDMQGGLWTLVTEQHGNPGKCRVSLYQFDDEWEICYEGKPSGEITREDCRLVPRSGTALYDAVVRSLAALEDRILKEPEGERPEKVVVVVITDGMNNASKENKMEDANQAIARATDKFNWEFVFMAADQAGFDEGAGMSRGTKGKSVLYDRGNSSQAYAAASSAISDFRDGTSSEVNLAGKVVDLQGKPITPDSSS